MGMVDTKTTLVIERPQNCEWLVRSDEKTFEVDLRNIHLAESRREEITTAYGRSLLELANAFDDGYDAACKLHSRVLYEMEMATIASRKRRAELLRDDFPAIIKARGWASARSPLGAEDIRGSLYYEDKQFLELESYRAALEAVKELVFGKMMSMNRICRRVESLLQRRDANTGGLGQHDPAGDRMDTEMRRLTEEHERVERIASPRRGFATKEKD